MNAAEGSEGAMISIRRLYEHEWYLIYRISKVVKSLHVVNCRSQSQKFTQHGNVALGVRCTWQWCLEHVKAQ